MNIELEKTESEKISYIKSIIQQNNDYYTFEYDFMMPIVFVDEINANIQIETIRKLDNGDLVIYDYYMENEFNFNEIISSSINIEIIYNAIKNKEYIKDIQGNK